MKSLVVGCGAIGSIIVGCLERAGREIAGVDPWFRHVEASRTVGLRVDTLEDSFSVRAPMLHMDEFREIEPVDLLIFATKSYDTWWASQLMRPYLNSTGLVISTQNGMNEPILAETFGRDRVVGCVVPMAAELLEPGHVRRTTSVEWGGLILGDFTRAASTRTQKLKNFLDPIGGVSESTAIDSELWGKLTLNVMSNAVSALTGLSAQELWSDDEALDVVVALAHEVARVAHASDVALAPVLKSIDHQLLLDASSFDGAAWQCVKTRIQTVSQTRSGISETRASMLQDVGKQRRTEINYLNGWVLTEARRIGLEVPANAATIRHLRRVEVGEWVPSPTNIHSLHADVRSFY